jgi:hypothetical protein
LSRSRSAGSADRSRVDADLAGARLDEKSPQAAAAATRRLAYAADPAGAVERGRQARTDLRVTLRPAPVLCEVILGPEQQLSVLATSREPTASVHRRGGGSDHGPGPALPRSVLHRTDPPSRSHRPFRRRGATTATNGRGLCERGNYVRELPGWTARLVDPDSHTVQITTPTGHSYLSRPDQPP